ncbi:MAG TPA: response regulator [Gemmataceae bacterium]|nr:response regulator [Gemmataceae bacterium]
MATRRITVSGPGGDDPALIADMSEVLLDEARGVAQAIWERVRRALRPSAPLRVLCVDDHPDAADTLAHLLELLGYETLACYDGPSALAAVAEFRPDVCVLDLLMPGMDGLELAARLKERAGRRPLLLVAATALGSVEDRTRTTLAGFHSHLLKPVDTSALLAALTLFGDTLERTGDDRSRD